METDKFYGIDTDIDTSLFEYGVLTSKDEKISIVGVANNEDGYYQFVTTDMKEERIAEIISESWFNRKKFFEYLGTNKKDWLLLNKANKLFDLVNYYGWDNYFPSHSIMTKKETEQFIRDYVIEPIIEETIYTAFNEEKI